VHQGDRVIRSGADGASRRSVGREGIDRTDKERSDGSGRSLTGFVADTISFSHVDGPGNRFVVFLQGCNFDCVACHNPQTIPGHGGVDGHHPQHRTVDDLLVEIRKAAPFISGVTVSGGEATQQPAFLHDLFAAIKADERLAGLTCFVDSNGACDPAVWDDLSACCDGAMIDLKCFDDGIHREMTGEPNHQVLTSIEHLQRLGMLDEVRLLLMVGVNDDPDLLRRTGAWLASIDPTMRVKLIAFRKHGARDHDPPLVEPTPDQMAASAAVLRSVSDFDLCLV
jgi:pyruvate-formate lyase-activating enzyme